MVPTKPLTLADFPLGTSAWLRTGGPEMIVIGTIKESRALDTPDQVVVAWFVRKELCKQVLPPAALSLAKPVEPKGEEDADG